MKQNMIKLRLVLFIIMSCRFQISAAWNPVHFLIPFNDTPQTFCDPQDQPDPPPPNPGEKDDEDELPPAKIKEATSFVKDMPLDK